MESRPPLTSTRGQASVDGSLNQLGSLPLLPYFAQHASPTFILSSRSASAQGHLPSPVWANDAGKAIWETDSDRPSGSFLVDWVDEDVRKGLGGRLQECAGGLSRKMGLQSLSSSPTNDGRSTSHPRTSSSLSTPTRPLLVRNVRSKGRPSSFYIDLSPLSTPSAESHFVVLQLHPIDQDVTSEPTSKPSTSSSSSSIHQRRASSNVTPLNAKQTNLGRPITVEPALEDALSSSTFHSLATSSSSHIPDHAQSSELYTLLPPVQHLSSSSSSDADSCSATTPNAASALSSNPVDALTPSTSPTDPSTSTESKRPTPQEKAARRKDKYCMKELIWSLDLQGTSLGPVEHWPACFKSALSIVLNTETESAIFWGPEHLAFYNDAYAEMISNRHPAMLGKPVRQGWSEVASLGPLFDSILRDGSSLHRFNERFFLNRDQTLKHPEENFQTWSLVPVEDEHGRNVGILNRSWETTRECLAERRLLTLHEVAQNTSSCVSIDDYAESVISALAINPSDLPFVGVYISESAATSKATPTIATSTSSVAIAAPADVDLVLKGTVGVPADHRSMPPVLKIRYDSMTFRDSIGRLTTSSGTHQTYSSAGFVESLAGGSTSTNHIRPPGSTRSRPVSQARQAAPPVPSESTLDGSELEGSMSQSTRSSRMTIYSSANEDLCPWPIRQALCNNEMVILDDCSELVAGYEPRAFDELPDKALVMPVESDGEVGTARKVVLIIGLNSRRPYDEEYEAWLKLVKLSLASGLSGVVSQEVQQMRADELARIDRLKSQFFTNVSHELRTPLTLIAGPIKDLLSMQNEDSAQKRLLSVTHRNVQRLSRLVDMLMDVSRVEAGRLEGLFSPRQLGRFTAGLAALFEGAIRKAGLELVVEWDESEERLVYVDSELWEKICFNIIGNAFKYTLEGKIRVFVEYRENDALFGVEDTGVGIPASDVPHVVERFHRVASTGRSYEGTGIGLALTAELVTLHGGELEVISRTAAESPEGSHGSTFIVHLPLGCAHLPFHQVDESILLDSIGTSKFTQSILEEATTWVQDEAGLNLSLGEGDSSIKAGSDRAMGAYSSEIGETQVDGLTTLFWSKSDTIMIVDDVPDMRRYLSSILEAHVTVVEAKDGQEAFELAQLNPPDLILTDHMMPRMDGAELIHAIRTSASDLALVPIILITARAGDQGKVDGLTSGAEDFLPKPFSSKELVARCHLQMQMGKRRIDLERRFAERTLELRVRAIEAEAKRKEADEQRRQQELLVDVTSHELRNPVSAILQNAQLVGENLRFLFDELKQASERTGGAFHPTPALLSMIDEDIEAMEAIYMMGMSQERIANDVLSLARIQLSTLEIFPVPIDLIAETKRICSVFASECRLKGIQLDLIHGESLKSLHALGFHQLLADPGRLGQVLINLLSNAIRFTAPSAVRKITLTIEVRKNPPDDDTCLPPPATARAVSPCTTPGEEEEVYIYGSVADSGPGLTPEELSRLFQRFQQASAQTHAVFGGSGLGLYVCRKICDLSDGKIEVVSDGKEAGSTFRFYVKAALSPKLSDLPSPSGSITPGKMATPSLSSPPATAAGTPAVLVVEDNLINQRVLVRQLHKAHISSHVANDGAEALEMIKTQAAIASPYKVILMDLEMPVMDGLTAVKLIREYEASGDLRPPHTPVFALTGNARQGQIDHALATGMDAVILKPYKIDDLLSKLRTVI